MGTELTPETLAYFDRAHDDHCYRYLNGLMNTQADQCDCTLGRLVASWKSDRSRLEAAERRVAECDADHPIEPAWAELLAAARGWRDVALTDLETSPYASPEAKRLAVAVAALAAQEGK